MAFNNNSNPQNNLINALLGRVANDPRLNNPQAQNYMRIIQNGDSKQIQQVATNVCNTLGISPEQAAQEALHFFNVK